MKGGSAAHIQCRCLPTTCCGDTTCQSSVSPQLTHPPFWSLSDCGWRQPLHFELDLFLELDILTCPQVGAIGKGERKCKVSIEAASEIKGWNYILIPKVINDFLPHFSSLCFSNLLSESTCILPGFQSTPARGKSAQLVCADTFSLSFKYHTCFLPHFIFSTLTQKNDGDIKIPILP